MGERSRKTTMLHVAETAGWSLSAVDRALTQRPARILRVGVLIQAPGNPFHAALREGIDRAARLHATLNPQFRVAHIDPNRPDRIARDIAEAPRVRDLLMASSLHRGSAKRENLSAA